LIKLDPKFYYNATPCKSFINKVYDLVGHPSYFRKHTYHCHRTVCHCTKRHRSQAYVGYL